MAILLVVKFVLRMSTVERPIHVSLPQIFFVVTCAMLAVDNSEREQAGANSIFQWSFDIHIYTRIIFEIQTNT